MKRLIGMSLALVLAASAAQAQPLTSPAYGSGSSPAHGRFHLPRFRAANDNARGPAGATARCRDGSFSMSLHHSGTCSHHGGVARWL